MWLIYFTLLECFLKWVHSRSPGHVDTRTWQYIPQFLIVHSTSGSLGEKRYLWTGTKILPLMWQAVHYSTCSLGKSWQNLKEYMLALASDCLCVSASLSAVWLNRGMNLKRVPAKLCSYFKHPSTLGKGLQCITVKWPHNHFASQKEIINAERSMIIGGKSFKIKSLLIYC